MDHAAHLTLPSIEEITQFVRKVAFDVGCEFPTLLTHGTKGSEIADFVEMPETNEAMAQVGRSMAKEGNVGDLIQVVLFAPAWMVTSHHPYATVRPSQDPNRREILLIARLIVEIKQVDVARLEIQRNRKGKITELKAMDSSGSKLFSVHHPLLTAFADGYTQANIDQKFN
jgi:hypothetical protein